MGEDLERRTGRTKKRTTLHTNRTVENQSRWTRAVRTSLREHEKHTRAPALRVLQELRRLAVLDAEIDRQQATFPRPALPPPPPKPTPLVLREGLHFTGKTCLHHHRRRLEPQDGEYGFPAPGEVPKPRRERENRSHQQLYGLFSRGSGRRRWTGGVCDNISRVLVPPVGVVTRGVVCGRASASEEGVESASRNGHDGSSAVDVLNWFVLGAGPPPTSPTLHGLLAKQKQSSKRSRASRSCFCAGTRTFCRGDRAAGA